MNGFETLSELNKNGMLCRLTVVLHTTSHPEREIILEKEFGAWSLLNKPPMHLLSQALQCIFEGCDTRTLSNEIMLWMLK